MNNTKEYTDPKTVQMEAFKHLSRLHNFSAGLGGGLGAFLSWIAGLGMASGVMSNNVQEQTVSLFMGVFGALSLFYGLYNLHRGALLAEKADELTVEQFAARKRP